MYCNGMGFRAIERCTGVRHNTVIGWVKETCTKLPETEEIEDKEMLQISIRLLLFYLKRKDEKSFPVFP
jgi:hypothetical protein